MKIRQWIASLLVGIGAVLAGRGLLHLRDPLVLVLRSGYRVPEQPGFVGIGIGGILIILGVTLYQRYWP